MVITLTAIKYQCSENVKKISSFCLFFRLFIVLKQLYIFIITRSVLGHLQSYTLDSYRSNIVKQTLLAAAYLQREQRIAIGCQSARSYTH